MEQIYCFHQFRGLGKIAFAAESSAYGYMPFGAQGKAFTQLLSPAELGVRWPRRKPRDRPLSGPNPTAGGRTCARLPGDLAAAFYRARRSGI